VLEAVTRAAAPLLPLTTEAIWRGLTGQESVHLADWPDLSSWPADDELVSAMDLVRAVCSTALSLRKARQLRVRLPLARLTVAHPDAAALAPYAGLIRDEVNVKEVDLSADPASLGTFELAVNPRVLGPRVGAKVQEVIKAIKAGNVVRSGDSVTAAGVELEPGEYEVRLAAAHPESTSPLPGNAGLVELDTAVTPELTAEGTARDVVRVVQQARRDAGLAVTDRIRLTVGADGAVADAVRAHSAFLAGETLAVEVGVVPQAAVSGTAQAVGDGGSVTVTQAAVPATA
jgi:isoleucyl-tRNA synthetase